MALIDLGKIKITNKGLWSNVSAYEVDDFVQDGKHTFICILANTNQDPYNSVTSTLNSTYWSFMAQGAEAGDWNAAVGTPEYITNKPKIIEALEVDKFENDGRGYRHYRTGFVLMKDGTIRCWGQNDNNALGDGSVAGTRYRPSTVAIPKRVTEFSIAQQSGLAITEDFECWAWGYNGYGQCGMGNTTQVTAPTKVPLPEGMTKFITCQVGGGSTYNSGNALYVCENSLGERYVYSTGYNGYGQNGDGTTTTRHSLTLIPTLNNLGVEKVYTEGTQYATAGAITSNGDVWIWGYNAYGQCGSGNLTNQFIPTKAQNHSLPNLPAKKLVISTQGSYGHVYILLENGALYFTGKNQHGVDGNGSAVNKSNWTLCGGDGASGVTDVVTSGTADTASTCILKSDGTIRTVGYNGYGQLGIGNTTSSTTWKTPPATRSYPGGTISCNSNIKKIFASQTQDGYQSFSFIRDIGEWDSHGHGKAFAWGANNSGGNGTGHRVVGGVSRVHWDSRYPDECLAPERVTSMLKSSTTSETRSFIILSDGVILSAGSGLACGRETDNEDISAFGRINL
jgi:hypothetical protein